MSSSDCFRQQTNPDISGVGIRISFYLQNFILVLLVNRSWEDAPNSLWTFIATNFGLTIAALAQLKGDELTLFEAIEVSYLVWLANFGTFLALASYSGQKEKYKARRRGGNTPAPKHDNFVMVGAVVQTFFSIILTLVMWASASEFGKSDPDETCKKDQIRFVIFAAPVHALTGGRIVALVCTSLILLAYIFMTYREIMASRRARKAFKLFSSFILRHHHGRHNDLASNKAQVEIQLNGTPTNPNPNEEQRPMDQHQNGFLNVPGIPLQQTASSSSTSSAPKLSIPQNNKNPQGNKKKRQHSKKGSTKDRMLQNTTTQRGRRNWVEYDRTLVGTFAMQMCVFTYFIVCNELYINGYNNSDGENRQWGFGQVFALIVIVPSVVSVIRAFHKHGLRRLDRQDGAANSAV